MLKKIPMILLMLCLVAWPNLSAQNPPVGTPHKATLTWVAPIAPGGSGIVSGYNVYRSTAGAQFSKINTSLIAGTVTVDNNVTANTPYAYCASMVDSKGGESPCSIQVSTTVPADRNPPTGLVAVSE